MTYQIMTDKDIIDNDKKRTDWSGKLVGDHRPDFERLISESSCEDEAEAWKSCRDFTDKHNIGFPFEFVGCFKQKCGHYEILQHPYNPECGYTEEYILETLAKEASERNCTECVIEKLM